MDFLYPRNFYSKQKGGDRRGESLGIAMPFLKFDFDEEEGAYLNTGLTFKNAIGNISADLNFGQSEINTFGGIGLKVAF